MDIKSIKYKCPNSGEVLESGYFQAYCINKKTYTGVEQEIFLEIHCQKCNTLHEKKMI